MDNWTAAAITVVGSLLYILYFLNPAAAAAHVEVRSAPAREKTP